MALSDSLHTAWFNRFLLAVRPEARGRFDDIAAAESSWYRPGQLLIHRDDAPALEGVRKELSAEPYRPDDPRLRKRGNLRYTADLNENLLKVSGFQLYITTEADDLPQRVAELQKEFAKDRGLSLNRVFFGEPLYHGGPGSPPVPADPPPGILDDIGRGSAPAPTVDLTVLDTGMPADWLTAHARMTRFIAAADVIQPDEVDLLDELPNDGLLDQQAAHGLFINGIVSRIAQGVRVDPGRVLDPAGDGDEATLVYKLAQQTAPVINLSLGGYTEGDEEPQATAGAIKTLVDQGKVIVAAAGNAGRDKAFDCRPFWPAAFEDVIAVGAYDSRDPGNLVGADFSNRGRWVDVCAPGVDVLSDFVAGWAAAGAIDRIPLLRELPFRFFPRKHFNGWARWSGTSFAAPVIAAEIARRVQESGTPEKARSIADDFLAGLPDSGWSGYGRIFMPGVDLTK